MSRHSTKLDNLAAVLDCKSTTKILGDQDINLFQEVFDHAISFQDPAARQIFLSHSNKLIKRLVDSHRVVMRDAKRFTDEDRSELTHRYITFLHWLVDRCFEGIYCNAYFGSFTITMSTLKMVIQHVTFDNDKLHIKQKFCERRCYDSILSCLGDSFEENKALALELLLLLPESTRFIDNSQLQLFDKTAYKLVESVNPAHSLTCQYVFKLIIRFEVKMESSKSKNKLLRSHLSRLLDLVEQGLDEMKEDFVSALRHRPIYPKLTCIRALLDEIDVTKLDTEEREEWVAISRRIVIKLIEACNAVSAIVCNLNPETIGHLPMDQRPIDAKSLSTYLKGLSLETSSEDLNTITSQMLLICGWKTIKECSLALGAMCTRLWWPKAGVKRRGEKFPGLKCDTILANEDMTTIIGFFDHYLRNLRHRGAFEQAYNGFILVTRRVWFDATLKELLIKTLEGIMGDFEAEVVDSKKEECLKAYVTRRSAGLPFIVQAILISEQKSESKTIDWVMNSLFRILKNSNTKEYQRLHCMNILKALIKEHALGHKVLPYVGETFLTLIAAFRSDSFPVRNCANMLLKATVDRTFGVNRLRNEIHRKNQLSFEKFFTDCENLHQKMLAYLTEALTDNGYLGSVHAIFIVLFRLRYSLVPADVNTPETLIKPFLEPIKKLALTCPDTKLRQIAAKLLVRLAEYCTHDPRDPKFYVVDWLCQGLQNLYEDPRIDNNTIHGSLCIQKSMVEILPFTQTPVTNDLIELSSETFNLIMTNDRFHASIKSMALSLAESYLIYLPSADNKWIYETLSETTASPPHFKLCLEEYIFRRNRILLRHPEESLFAEDILAIADIVRTAPSIDIGTNLQSSLVRLIRHHIGYVEDLESFLDKLDIDLTAAFTTPHDELHASSENEDTYQMLKNYCYRQTSTTVVEAAHQIIKNLSTYVDFEDSQELSPKVCNTARAIEVLALAIRLWNWDKKLARCDDNFIKLLMKLIRELPDCDVKCLATLYCGLNLGAICLDVIEEIDTDRNPRNDLFKYFESILASIVPTIVRMSGGDRSFTIRISCVQFLNSVIPNMVKLLESHNEASTPANRTAYRCLMRSLFSLVNDEDPTIRKLSKQIYIQLKGQLGDPIQSTNPDNFKDIASDLAHLITRRIGGSFANLDDLNQSLSLFSSYMFAGSQSFTGQLTDEKDRLFDKTKLNTFADQIVIVESCILALNSLCREISDSSGGPVDLDDLFLPIELVDDFILSGRMTHDIQLVDNIGDYSWRHKQLSSGAPKSHYGDIHNLTNSDLINQLYTKVSDSLNYMARGHSNMITDTDYTHRELQLFRRLQLLVFIYKNTSWGSLVSSKERMNILDQRLRMILSTSCATTMLLKCEKVVRNIVEVDS